MAQRNYATFTCYTNRVLQQLLEAFLDGLAPLSTNQNENHGHALARAQQLLQKGLAEETGSAGQQDHRLGEEPLDRADPRLVARVLRISLRVRRSHFNVCRCREFFTVFVSKRRESINIYHREVANSLPLHKSPAIHAYYLTIMRACATPPLFIYVPITMEYP